MSSQTTAPALAQAPRRPAWRASRFALAGGSTLAVFETGRTDPAAPVLVCVHGIGHWTQAAWDFVAGELEATHRIVAFDLPGFGASDKPDVAYTLDFFAAVLGNVVDGYAPGAVTLVGHSLGGLVASLYAAGASERVRLLVLIAPAGFLRTPALLLKLAGSRPVRWLFGRVKPSPNFVRRTFANAVFDRRVIPEDYYARAVALSRDPALLRAFADVYARALAEFVRMHELHARLAGFRGRALLIWGRADRYVPVAGLAAARRVYPQAETLVLQECGHCPSIEAPSAVASAIRRTGG